MKRQLWLWFISSLIIPWSEFAFSSEEIELVPGRYYQGDGLGVNITVQLNADHTYNSVWNGCLGNYGNSKGSWSLSSNELLFFPSEEDGMLKGSLEKMKIVRYKKLIGFVPISELKEHEESIKKYKKSMYVYLPKENEQ